MNFSEPNFFKYIFINSQKFKIFFTMENKKNNVIWCLFIYKTFYKVE